MKEYYKMAIETGKNETAMHNLGYYYQYIEKDYDSMKIYRELAIEHGSVCSMYHLGYYYQFVEKDYDLMKKYYTMAIDCNGYVDSSSLNNFGFYYQHYEHNSILMKTYYLLAIEHGSKSAMRNLGTYYEDIGNYELAEKYYTMSFENGNAEGLFYLYNLKQDYDKILECDNKIVRKHRPKLYQFHCARKAYIRKDVCDICSEEKSLYPYDCMCHFMCLNCYIKVDKCGICKCPKNPYFKEIEM
jgi:tetratricopeptide (TPR) repeat protein